MTLTGDNLIAGRWQRGAGAAMTSQNPVTDEAFWSGHAASVGQANDALDAADEAFSAWRKKPFDARLAVLERFTAIATERKEEMARLITRETGKALWDARTEAAGVAGKLALAIKAYHERTPTKSDGSVALTHRPHGVCVVIGPFNFPAHLPNGHIVPALLAGNTIVLKPSEQTPAVAELMCQWWLEAGLPEGVMNLVHGGADIAQNLVQHRLTRGVFFTGGVHAGVAIHKALAGSPDKILALELGGNNPLVAWGIEDADAAARIIVRSAYISGGQRCTCARRLIVENGPHGDAVIAAVDRLIPSLRMDMPDAEPEPFIGSLINARAADAVLGAQAAMLDQGASAIRPAGRSNLGAAFVTPGLIDTTHWAKRQDEEVFGPLLQVIRTDNFDDAMDIANDTRFGLAAGLLADDEKLWLRFRTEINSGIVNWNRQTTGASGTAPFGGPGFSGNHRPAGYYSADYCAWPMASMVQNGPLADDIPTPGLSS